jgi:hypothetical protein
VHGGREAIIAAMTETELEVGIGAFAGISTCDFQPGPRVRAASTMKPLLAWAAAASDALADNRARWEVLARRSITASDNGATAEVWSDAGREALLASLGDRVGLSWQIDGDGEHPSLRVIVTAGNSPSRTPVWLPTRASPQ